MADYTWVRVRIDTHNRDRQGGHGNTYVADGMGYREPHGPKGALFLKRKTRRKQRREHAKITREAVASYYNEVDEYLFSMEGFLDYTAYDYMGDYMYEPYEEIQYDYFDDYCYDPYEYEDYAYMDAHYASRDYSQPAYARIIREEDAGKSLGEILEEILSR